MTATAPMVLGFGALSTDEIVYVDAPLTTGKGKVLWRTNTFGGNVATALSAVARLGGAAGFIGWLSSDPDDPALRDLEAGGVSTGFAPRHPDAQPIRSRVIVGADGDRFIAYDDDVLLGTREDLDDEILRSAAALVVDGYAVHATPVVARARALGRPVIADIEWSAGNQTDFLIEICDHLVLPLGFARSLTGRTAPQAMLDDLWSGTRSAVVLTDGSNGAYYLGGDGSKAWHLPAHDVDVIDTTGAGDCFHGAYAQALVCGQSLADCVAYASAAAAISVTGRGGREALPCAKTVRQRLAKPKTPVPAVLV